MSTFQNLGQKVKQQIMVCLQALVTAGAISSFYEIDQNPNALTMEPTNGYPFAIVVMSCITIDFEDQANDMRVYRWDIMFVVKEAALADQSEGAEVLIDQVLNEFDSLTNLTLGGAAPAGVLPAEVQRSPVSTGDKTYLCFLVTIRARTLFQTT